LNASAPEEISFLVDWISSDWKPCSWETHARGIVLVLLTYHQPNPWQLGAYQDIQMKYGPRLSHDRLRRSFPKASAALRRPDIIPINWAILIAQTLVKELQVFLYPLAPSGRIAVPPIPQR
jgi:hypothetical protein